MEILIRRTEDEAPRDLAKEMRQEVAKASRHAPIVEIDPETGIDSDTKALQDETIELMRQGENMHFDFDDRPNSVYVESPEDFPLLAMLGLRQLLKVNFGLTEKQLDSKKYQNYYAAWYKTNIDYQVSHEGDHDKMVRENTNLKTRLGIRFIKTPDGMKIVPDIDIAGDLTRTVFIEKIIKGVGKLSKADEYIVDAYEKIIESERV